MNKTTKYLSLLINEIDEGLKKNLINLKKHIVGFYIGVDEIPNEPQLVIALNVCPEIQDVLDYIHLKPDLIIDEIEDIERHVIILKIPKQYEDCYWKFIDGKYSEMYSNQFINRYVKEDYKKKDILTKNKEYKERLEASLAVKIDDNAELEDRIDFDQELYFTYKGG